MPSRSPALWFIVAVLGGCAHAIPQDPGQPDFSWELVRDQLPATSARALVVASTAGRTQHVIEGGDNSLVRMPVYAFVLEHPTEGVILVDTGYGRRTASNPDDYPGRQTSRLLRLQMEPDAAVADRLSEIQRSISNVRHMVVTHLHSDHVGGVEDFPRAALWVHRDEWEAADEPGPLGTKPDLRPFGAHRHVKTVDFTGTAPYGPFEGHVDLFGDGSLVLLPTPGHTVGHISVLVNLPGQSLLILGDCAWIDRHWQEGLPKGRLVRELLEADWNRNMKTLWRIRHWARKHPELLIISGHEAANLERLKVWPEAYE